MEETKITLEEYLNKIIDDKSFSQSFIRKYVPFNEKGNIIDLALTIIFGTFDSESQLNATDVYQEPNTLIDDLFINTSIIKAYTGIDVSDKVAVYDAFMKDGLYEKLLEEIPDAKDFDYIFNRRICEKREYIKENRKSSMDEVLESVSTLLQTLNSKAEQLDMKKLEKQFKKLNVNEIMKQYQKSGIGESQRDKIIQEQAIKIKELENQISARNVINYSTETKGE